MDLSPYIDNLRDQLLAAAESGTDDAKELARQLTAPLGVATRLALLEALSSAADEITAELAPGSVEVRLRGGSPTFVVTPPPSEVGFDDVSHDVMSPPPRPPADTGEGATARITLRLPEQVKAQIEQAAGSEGLSVNAWLSRAVTAALEQPMSHKPQGRAGIDHFRGRSNQRFSGWVR